MHIINLQVSWGIDFNLGKGEYIPSCAIKVCSPKMVFDLKWFLTYKNIFKFEMCISLGWGGGII